MSDLSTTARIPTLVAVAATVVTIVVMDWVPTPLNRNILLTSPGQRWVGTLIHASAGSLVFAANVVGRRWSIFAGAVWYSIVFASALLNWWVPYVFGIYPGEISLETFEAEYSRNLSVLPRIAGHPVVPDVQHTLIHLGLLASCVLSWLTFVRLSARQRRLRQAEIVGSPGVK